MSQALIPAPGAAPSAAVAAPADPPPAWPRWAGPPAAADEIHLRDAWTLLVRRRWLVAGVTLLSLAAGAAVVYRTTPVYQSAAALRVDDPQPLQISGLAAAALGGGNNTLLTEIETLRSRTLAAAIADSFALRAWVTRPAGADPGQVVSAFAAPAGAAGRYRLAGRPGGRFAVFDAATGRRLGTARAGAPARLGAATVGLSPLAARYRSLEIEVLPADEAADRVLERLRVSRRNGDVNVVDVRFRAAHPRLARDVANALVAAFMAGRRDAVRAQSHATAAFLRGQVARVSAQLDSAEGALRRFQEGARIVSLEQQAGAAVQGAAQMQAQRDALEAESGALAALLARADAAPAASGRYRDLAGFPSLLRNPAVSGLLTSLAGVEDRRTELLARRNAADPEVQLLDGRARQIEAQLGATARAYQQGLAGQAAALGSALARANGEMAAIPGREVRLARLRRDARVLEEIHSQMQARLKEAEIGEAAEDPSVRLLDAAVLPREPVAPRPAAYLSVALAAGLVLGISAAALREYADRAVHSRADVLRATGLPVLAMIPRTGGRRKGVSTRGRGAAATAGLTPGRGTPRLLLKEPRTPLAEAYDRFQVNLAFSRVRGPVRAVTISSATPGEGKTTTAVNLAVTLARRGRQVLLVDGDLRCGVVSGTLGVPQSPGLAELLAGTALLPEAVRRVRVDAQTELSVVAGGRSPDDPARLLALPELRALLERLRGEFDAVVVDAPPVNLVTDAALLGDATDGVVLVVRSGTTTRDELGDAVDHLRAVGVQPLGVVLNGVDFRRERGYDRAYAGYSRGYGYYD
ncbi:MAG TPA: polysaccharide biosynthesis tyrosine autokinase [Longimicrobium sp.]|nr:polysaccharide biosynthesis tyrosine autokinase [Longimicrobium sp.]